MEIEKQKCNGCKRLLSKDTFFYNNKQYKRCFECNQKSKKWNKNVCETCGIGASFNFNGEQFGVRCSKHKKIGMVDVRHKKCIYKGCTYRPTFNYENEKTAIYCSTHKEPNMINIKNKKCKYKGCKQSPCFNYEDQKSPIYCLIHKESGMIDVIHKKCKFEGCTHRPSFNFKTETVPLYCSIHKNPDMVNVRHKKCIEPNCFKTNPSFNFIDQKEGLYCSIHKKPNMINIKAKKCKHIDCVHWPSFNYEDQKIPIYCSIHKEPGMIDIVSKKCKHEGCEKNPCFNYEDQKSPIYCLIHKEPGMIDVKHKKCQHIDCSYRPYYAYPNNKPTHCSIHRLDGMIKNPNTKCNFENCSNNAQYGTKTPLHCFDHKEPQEINLVERECKQCKKIDIVNKDGICINFCLQEDKYYNIYRKYTKEKETRVYNILKGEFGEPFSHDKIIDSKCGKERPDIVYDCDSHFVIVEVDENMHKHYTCADPNIRLQNICFAFGLPCIFIRYNPDDFKIDGKLQKIPYHKKEEMLIKWIKKAKEDTPEELENEYCRAVYLYYDDFDITNTEYTNIPLYE